MVITGGSLAGVRNRGVPVHTMVPPLPFVPPWCIHTPISSRFVASSIRSAAVLLFLKRNLVQNVAVEMCGLGKEYDWRFFPLPFE